MSEALGIWTANTMFPPRSHRKPFVAPWRRAARVASGTVQALGFAAVMWLLLAGPGFVSDSAGHPPAAKVARR